MGVPSSCGLLVLVVLGCVLPTILAAPSNVGEQGQNGLAHQNDKDTSEEVDENPFAVAAFVAKHGCSFAKVAAGMCRLLRNGEIDDDVMDVERSEVDELDELDLNKIREIVKKYGCPLIKGVAAICGVFSG